MGVDDQRHASAALPPGKTPGIHYIQGWEGPRDGLDGCRKCRHHRELIPEPTNLLDRHKKFVGAVSP
jgi:hypothetical protein